MQEYRMEHNTKRKLLLMCQNITLYKSEDLKKRKDTKLYRQVNPSRNFYNNYRLVAFKRSVS